MVNLAIPQPVCEVNDYFTDTIPGVPYTASFRNALPASVRIPSDGVYLASFTILSLIHTGGTLKYNITGAEVSGLCKLSFGLTDFGIWVSNV